MIFSNAFRVYRPSTAARREVNLKRFTKNNKMQNRINCKRSKKRAKVERSVRQLLFDLFAEYYAPLLDCYMVLCYQSDVLKE